MKKLTLSLLILLIFVTSVVIISCSSEDTSDLGAEILPIKDGRKGIITIVHDDGTLDTVWFLYDEFYELNLRGSIALIANRVVAENGTPNSSYSDWKIVAESGLFEIANHTYSHTFWGTSDEANSGTYIDYDGITEKPYNLPAGYLTREIINSGNLLRQIFPTQRVLTFVTPIFGRSDSNFPAPMQMIADNYVSNRLTYGEANFDGTVIQYMNKIEDLDFNALNSYFVMSTDDYAKDWFEYVDNAINYNAWGIYCFHQISPDTVTTSHTVSQYKVSELLTYIAEKQNSGDLWCATLGDATLYLMEAKNATVSTEYEKNKITITLTDDLDNDIYNMELTVKVDIPSSWTSAKQTIGTKSTSLTIHTDDDGTKYVLLNIVPDNGKVYIDSVK